MMINVSNLEAVQAMVRELEGETMSQVDVVMKLLESLATEPVINELLEAFKNPSRSLRNRAYQVLSAIGERTLNVCTWKLKHLGDPRQFPRLTESGELNEESFYVARNCLELTEKLGSKRDIELIRQVSDDPDPRLRAAAIVALAKFDSNEGLQLAKLRISDGDPIVAEAAINVLGQQGGEDVIPALVDLFYAEPKLRLAIINAFGRIGRPESEKLLIDASYFRRAGALAKIFREDVKLRAASIKALGAAGGSASVAALKRFERIGSNFFMRLLFVPWEFPKKELKELIKVARDSAGRIEYRLKGKAAKTE